MRSTLSIACVLTLGLVGAGHPLRAQEKPVVKVTEAQAKAALAVAAASAKTNYVDLASNFEKEVKKSVKDYDNDPIKIYTSPELQVVLFGPAQSMLSNAVEGLRNRGGIGTVGWVNAVTVFVAPANIDSPDVVSVSVTRDGKPVEMVRSDLKETEFTNIGTQRIQNKVHEGAVTFPIVAFEPGAKVVVTATAVNGRKLSRTLGDYDLKKIN